MLTYILLCFFPLEADENSQVEVYQKNLVSRTQAKHEKLLFSSFVKKVRLIFPVFGSKTQYFVVKVVWFVPSVLTNISEWLDFLNTY